MLSRLKIVDLVMSHQALLIAMAVLIGTIAGMGEWAFRSILTLTNLYGLEGLAWSQLPWWHRGSIVIGGGVILGLWTHFVLPDQRPHGVADVIEASSFHNARMSLGTGLKAITASAISIGSGGSVGREGPIVHLGASLASYVARFMKLPTSLARTILGCGIAGGIAAAFNAPIAAVFFALEVVIGHYALSAFTPIVVAAVVGTMFNRLHLGDDENFQLVTDLTIGHWQEFLSLPLLGILCAVMAVMMITMIFAVQEGHDRLQTPPWLRPIMGAVVLAIIGIQFPQVLGIGYELMLQVLTGELVMEPVGIILIVKLIASAICLGSLYSGGIFSPSLMIGALTGAFFGYVMQAVFGASVSDVGVYAILGMAAVSGSVMGAPISTILIVFELTRNYELTIALMATVGIAATILREAKFKTYFIRQLFERGVIMEAERTGNRLRQIKIRQLIRDKARCVSTKALWDDIAEALKHAPYGLIWVVNAEGRLVGQISLAHVLDRVERAHKDLRHDQKEIERHYQEDIDEHEHALADEVRDPRRIMETEEPLVDSLESMADVLQIHADAVMEPVDDMILYQNDHLRHGLEVMDEIELPILPVVDDPIHQRLVGVIHAHDLVRCHFREVQRSRAEERGDPVPPPLFR